MQLFPLDRRGGFAGDTVAAVFDSIAKPILSLAVKELIVLPIEVSFCFTLTVISAFVLELPEK